MQSNPFQSVQTHERIERIRESRTSGTDENINLSSVPLVHSEYNPIRAPNEVRSTSLPSLALDPTGVRSLMLTRLRSTLTGKNEKSYPENKKSIQLQKKETKRMNTTSEANPNQPPTSQYSISQSDYNRFLQNKTDWTKCIYVLFYYINRYTQTEDFDINKALYFVHVMDLHIHTDEIPKTYYDIEIDSIDEIESILSERLDILREDLRLCSMHFTLDNQKSKLQIVSDITSHMICMSE